MRKKGFIKQVATLVLSAVMAVSTLVPTYAADSTSTATEHVAVLSLGVSKSDENADTGFSARIIKAAGGDADNVKSVVFVGNEINLSSLSREELKTIVDLSVSKDEKTGVETDSTKETVQGVSAYKYHAYALYDGSTGTVKIFSEADKVYANSRCNYLFSNVKQQKNRESTFKNLTNIDLSGIDWSNTVELQCMFYGLTSLKSLDLSGYNFNIDAIEKYSKDTYKMSSMCTSWMFANTAITTLILPTNWRFLGSTGLSGNWAYKSNTGDNSKDGNYTSYDIEMPSGLLGGGKGGAYVYDSAIKIDHTDAEKKNDLEKVYWALEKGYENIHEIHTPDEKFTAFCIDEYAGMIEGYYKKELYDVTKETNGSVTGSSTTLWMINENKGYFDSEEGKRGYAPLGDNMEQALIALAYWGPQIYSLDTEAGYKALQEDIYYFTDGYNGVKNFKNAAKWEGHTYKDIPNYETYALYVYVSMDGRQNMITTESVKPAATSILISKTEITGKKEIGGAELTITSKDGSYTADKWTSEEGKSHQTSLVDGEYVLTETTAPAGYKKAESINFKVSDGKVYLADKVSGDTVTYKTEAVGNKTGTNYPLVTMKDEYKTVSVSFKKVDTNGNGLGTILAETVTDEALEKADDAGKKTLGYDGTQARLRIKSISTTVGVTVDKIFYSQSNGRTLDLYPGTYTLSEVTAPVGYAKAASIDFKIDDEGKLYFAQKNADGSNKVDNNGNIQYVATAEKTAEVTMTDELDTTPHDVLISKTDIYGAVKNDKTGEYTVNEIAGAKLTITDKDGKTVDSWTSEAGKTHTTSLPQGTYTLTEKSAPDGYKLADDITFVIDGAGKVSSATTKDGTAAYHEGLGTIIMKDDFKNVTVKISKVDIAGDEIEGAKLTITDKDGKTVDSWTSKKDKVHETTLYPGTYTLTETTSPKGYEKAESITFTVSDDGKGAVKVGTDTCKDNTVTMTDAYKEHDVVVSKQDTSKNRLSGALLTVTYTEKSSNGKTETKTVSGAPWTTEAGKDKTLSLVPGAYTLHETSAPDGYSKASDIVFTVAVDGSVKITSSGSGTYSGQVVDGKIVMYDLKTTTETPGTISIRKVDSKTGSYVSGAKLQILDVNGKTIEEWTSDSGAHTISATLTVGSKYTLHEVTAPDGYNKANDITFTATTKSQTVTMKDAPKTTETKTYTIRVKKIDEKGNRVSGAEMEIRDSDGNTVESWTTGNNDYTVTSKLTDGKTYTIHESSAPDGYEIAADKSFTYSKSRTIEIVDKKKTVTPTTTENKTTETPATTTEETPKTETTSTPTSVVRDNPTGDASNIPLWIGLAIAACAGISAVVIVNKRKKKEDN